MIKLFNYKENNFNSNGIATIKPLTLMEYKEESLNGWHIETEIPIKYNDLIEEGMIALVETKSKGAQPFLISNITKTTKTLHFIAKHYVFDAINYVLEDVRPTNMSAAGALKYINDRTDIKSPFTTNSNVSASNTAYFINRNMLEALDTIQERWGGVYDIDKFHINLKNKVGIDRGDTIMYSKNLEGLKVYEDWSNVVTKLLPVGFDGLLLPEKYLYSKNDYGKPYTKVIKFETELEDEDRTEENLLAELRVNAEQYLKENEVPKLSYEVESNINQELGIGDTIHVKHPVVDILTEVIAYEYNVLTKRITKLIFGNYKRNVKKKVDAIKESIKEVAEKANDFEVIIGDQTNLINDMNKKGHVFIDDNQIMVLDKIPKETAKHVWRWNMGGLGYSENGIEGPFKQAWTIDGVFNTDFIAANSIMTNHLHSDVGSSLDISSNVAITSVVNQLDNINSESNLIPNLISSVGTSLWTFIGGKRKLTSDNYLFAGGTLNTTFIPKRIQGSLSQWGKSFYTSGSAISPKGYVVPGYKYSYRSKRFTGSQSLEIILHEFSYLEQETAFKKTSLFKGNDEIAEFTTQLDNRTNFVSLEFKTGSDVTINNRLEIANDMFNRGKPKDWEQSADEVKMFAESQITQLDDRIISTIEEVNLIDGKVESNKSNISQLSNEIDLKVDIDGIIAAVNLSEEGVKIRANNIDLRGYTTFTDLKTAGSTVINGNNIQTGTISARRIDFNGATGRDVNLTGTIKANRGNIGGFDIFDDRLASVSKTHDFRIVLGGDSRQGDRWPIWMGEQSSNTAQYIVKPGGSTHQVGEAYFGDGITVMREAYFADNIKLIGELKTYATTALNGGLKHIVGGRTKNFISVLTNNGTRVYVNELTPDGISNPIIGTSSNRFNSIFLTNQPNVSSDPRLKRNISELPKEIIEGIGKLKPIQYTQGGNVHYGYNAQEVEYVLYQYCLNKYGWENAPLAMERYAFMHKDESYLSLLYGEIQVIKDKYYQDKLEDLQLQINKLTEVLNEIIK